MLTLGSQNELRGLRKKEAVHSNETGLGSPSQNGQSGRTGGPRLKTNRLKVRRAVHRSRNESDEENQPNNQEAAHPSGAELGQETGPADELRSRRRQRKRRGVSPSNQLEGVAKRKSRKETGQTETSQSPFSLTSSTTLP